MASYRPSRELRIAKPCTESWEAMTGNSRTRHCEACERDVLNTAAMTPAQIEAVLAKPGPLPCMRLVRLEDGNLLIAQEHRKASLLTRAAAAISAAFLTTAAAAQTSDKYPASLQGIITDSSGAPISNATVELRNGNVLVATVETDTTGEFVLRAQQGTYQIDALAPGFAKSNGSNVVLSGPRKLEKPIPLSVGMEMVGLVVVPKKPLKTKKTEEPRVVLDLAAVANAPGNVRSSDPAHASLRGSVVDPVGAAIAKADVSLTNVVNGVKFVTQTDDKGEFVLPVPSGKYAFAARASGFRVFAFYDVDLSGDLQVKGPIRLVPGKNAETITVGEIAADYVSHDSMQLEHNISSQQISELPM